MNMKGRPDSLLDHELEDLPPELRWREWMRRIEAVLFASASPVARVDLARIVGQEVSVDLLINDLTAELVERPYEVAAVADGWMLRTRPTYASVIRAAADVGGQDLDLREFDVAVLAAIAYHQPRPDRAAAFSRLDRDRAPQPAPRCALHIRHHANLPRGLRSGEFARFAGPGADGGFRVIR